MPLEQHIVCFLLWAGTNSTCIALFPGRFVSIEKEARSEEEGEWHGTETENPEDTESARARAQAGVAERSRVGQS